jgi:hypothetical protein
MKNGIIVLCILAMFFYFTCDDKTETSRDSSRYQTTGTSYQKTPVDELIRDMSAVMNYSIILEDMDYNESLRQYRHKYQILKVNPHLQDSVEVESTPWKKVDERFFNQHIDHLGMEIVTKKDGKVAKEAAPAGYTNFVGNEKYGQWRERNGSSFWEFYGKYAFMSSMFNLAMMPVRYSYWNDYHRNYYGYGRSYYGPRGADGRHWYGTNSRYSDNTRSKTTWSQKPSTFKQRVRSKVSQSKSATRKSSRFTRTKRTRSSSRYSKSSFRSRGGSFGK